MADLEQAETASNQDRNEEGDGTLHAIDYIYVYTRSNNVALDRIHAGLLFPNITIPRGSTINSATMEIYRSAILDPAHDMNVDIYGNDVDNAVEYATEADVKDRALTDASVPWVEDDQAGGWRVSPDIAAVIQEIVSRPGFASGNNIAILLIAKGVVDKQWQGYSWDGHANKPHIHINYDEPVPGAPSSQSLAVLAQAAGII